MRKRRKLVIGVVLCLAMLSLLAVPLLAQGAGFGAVKLPLYVLDSSQSWDDPCGGWGPQVGSVKIGKPNVNGKLIIGTRLDNGRPDATFNIYAKINGPDYIGPVGQLMTNRQGKGNTQVELHIPDGGDTLSVQVAVRTVTWPTEPYCYITPHPAGSTLKK